MSETRKPAGRELSLNISLDIGHLKRTVGRLAKIENLARLRGKHEVARKLQELRERAEGLRNDLQGFREQP